MRSFREVSEQSAQSQVLLQGCSGEPLRAIPAPSTLAGRFLTCGHLVSEASAAAVDHHAHLTLVVDAHLLGSVVVVDLIHHLDLGVVVSSSQSPQLQITSAEASS